MTFIGNNIKKIRGVKSLSQTDFADLFNLKRASIGAYEEGRAEPKIATVIEIANHFGISIDHLLNKELSVNDLSRFDIFKEELAKEVVHNLRPSKVLIDIIPIPYVSVLTQKAYLEKGIKSGELPVISLPMKKGQVYRAFEMSDNAMLQNTKGAGNEDIVIGCRPEGFDKSKIEVNKLYLLETSEGIYFRKVIAKNLSSIIAEAQNPDFYQVQLNLKDIIKAWQVCEIVTKNIGNTDGVSDRVKRLEDDVRLLLNRKS